MRLATLPLVLFVLIGSTTAAAQEASPTSLPSASATPSPSQDVAPSDEPTADPADPGTASPDTTSAPDAHDGLRAAVAEVATAEGRLPLGPDDATDCPIDAIELAWEPVAEQAFEVGGFVEPLVEPSPDAPDRATGIARCGASDHAVAGFDAFLEDGTWTIYFVSPLVDDVEHDDSTHVERDATGPAERDGVQAASGSATGSIPDPPDWPAGMSQTAEPLSGSDPQDTCDPDAKPGALALTDLLRRTYGTTAYGISRDCSIGDRSEHKEGRAVDWMIDASDTTERQIGDAFTSWILSTDPWGNDHAGMRRLGIMYMIWNRQSIYSWAVEDGWRAYTGSSPHTDHVHFSMTWPGARCQTSFWLATDCTGDVDGAPPAPSGGDIDDLLLFRNSDRRVVSLRVGAGGKTSTAWWTNWRRNWTNMVAADLDADGSADDVLLYNAQTGAYSMQAFRDGVPSGITSGTWWTGWDISAGDFDGNGVTDDLLLIRPGGRYNITHIGAHGATARQSSGVWQRVWTHAVPADLDGDGVEDDFLLYDHASGNYSMQRVVDGEAVGHRTGRWWSGWDALVPGDHDGNGARDDFLLYRDGDRRYNITHVRPDGTTDRQDHGYWNRHWSSLTAADLDADGTVDDVLLYNDGTGAYSMQEVTTSGPRGINWSNWSSGWEFLPAGEFS